MFLRMVDEYEPWTKTRINTRFTLATQQILAWFKLKAFADDK